MNSSRTRQAPALTLASLALLGVVALLTSVSSATANPIQSKRAQAQAVLAQIHESDIQLEKAIESYNYANVQLDQIDADLNSNARHLVVAQKSLNSAQSHIAERLRALYINGDGGGAVEILLGAENLDDLLGRLDMVQRVGDQDAKVLGDVRAFRKDVKERAGAAEDGARRPGQASGRARRDRSGRSRASSHSASRCWRGSRARSGSCRPRKRAGRHSFAPRPKPGSPRSSAPPRRLARQRRSSAPAASPIRSIPPTEPRRRPDSGGAARAVRRGRRACDAAELGKPYVWGAAGPSTFDCSGLVMYVYAQVGVSLPHNAAAQYGYGIAGLVRRPAGRRPRLLQRARPRRHLHRRRPVHPRPAHGRRRQDLEPERPRRLRRRPPPLARSATRRDARGRRTPRPYDVA